MPRHVLLYTALLLGANSALAGEVDWQAVKDAGLAKLVPTENAAPLSEIAVTDRDGNEHSLSDYKGKVILLNFWATWCAPCREEMPSLDKLQAKLGGDDFQVLTIATGRNPVAKIDKFFDETGVENLPVLLDPKQALARSMGVVGLPVTVLIDRDGNEVARLLGDADWSGPAAQSLITQMTAP